MVAPVLIALLTAIETLVNTKLKVNHGFHVRRDLTASDRQLNWILLRLLISLPLLHGPVVLHESHTCWHRPG